jgi:hypothetical protein
MGLHKGECPYLGCLSESGINQAFTQVLFAWQFRLVVKLTDRSPSSIYPSMGTVSNRTLHATSRPIRSIRRHLHFIQVFGCTPGNIYTPVLIPGRRSPTVFSQRNGGIHDLTLSSYFENLAPSGAPKENTQKVT